MGAARRAGRIIDVLIIIQMVGGGVVNFALEAPLFEAAGADRAALSEGGFGRKPLYWRSGRPMVFGHKTFADFRRTRRSHLWPRIAASDAATGVRHVSTLTACTFVRIPAP